MSDGLDRWEYHPSPDLGVGMTEALKGFPREPSMLHYAIRSLAALVLRGWMRIYHRLDIHGRENLPCCEAAVLVCNHTSHLDTLSLLCAVPLARIHKTFPAAAADYFFSSLPRSAVSAILINALPFDRETRGAESLAVCEKLLETPGNLLILFPEGTRTTSGQPGRFKSGIGRLVAGTETPVVPCHLAGGHAAWPKGRWIPRPRKLVLRIGAPQRFDELDKTRESVARVCATLRDAVTELGGRQ